ncbi:hypothetical protein [Flavobacterium ajazii]|uniref:hypothetical protein n=1 Tax=Flavobacterium ajazii TaxID=2692318 RepID=UPI0013D05459|nr:hypothetical protein [Flavobacterium ajazii]
MARIIIGFIICFLLGNCAKKKENIIIKNKPYIIAYEDIKSSNYLKKKNIPLPPKGFYSESQLLIDKKGHFYYYQKEHFRAGCGTKEESDTLPHFINLKPNDIIIIPEESLTNFLSQNILNKVINRRILIVASQNDTIKNTSFFNFINKNQLIAYQIRRTTQEEDTVLKYKLEDKYYSPQDIKWDQNRITLPFIKPKLK